jgi:hypothetical protein
MTIDTTFDRAPISLPAREAITAARQFIEQFVATDREWNTHTLASFLPEGWCLPDEVDFCDDPTSICRVATFLRNEAVTLEARVELRREEAMLWDLEDRRRCELDRQRASYSPGYRDGLSDDDLGRG